MGGLETEGTPPRSPDFGACLDRLLVRSERMFRLGCLLPSPRYPNPAPQSNPCRFCCPMTPRASRRSPRGKRKDGHGSSGEPERCPRSAKEQRPRRWRSWKTPPRAPPPSFSTRRLARGVRRGVGPTSHAPRLERRGVTERVARTRTGASRDGRKLGRTGPSSRSSRSLRTSTQPARLGGAATDAAAGPASSESTTRSPTRHGPRLGPHADAHSTRTRHHPRGMRLAGVVLVLLPVLVRADLRTRPLPRLVTRSPRPVTYRRVGT